MRHLKSVMRNQRSFFCRLSSVIHPLLPVLWLMLLTLAFSPVSWVPAANAATITLGWDPNQETNLAGYKIHYGTASKNYDNTVDVGNNTSITISGLQEGKTYFFSATAYNTDKIESSYSAEVDYLVPFADSDGDGMPDDQDAFPQNPDEWIDTDGDGIGNNGDPDDDDDGMPDDWEIQYGLDPLIDDANEDADGDGVTNLDEFLAGTNPIVPKGNTEPDPPELLSPSDTQMVALTPELRIGEFYDPDFGDTHAKTRWYVYRKSDNVCVLDITSADALTSLEVPKLILDEDTDYLWKAIFYDNHGAPSDWSSVLSFTTDITGDDTDGNGIPDHQETDPAVDMNRDGIADADQKNIKSIKATGKGKNIGIGYKTSGTVLAIELFEYIDPNNLQAAQALNAADDLPYGLISYRLIVKKPGNLAKVTVYLSEPAAPDARWHKYDSIHQEWEDFSANAVFSADRMSVTVTLEDGGIGDEDGNANGRIVDPSGLVAGASGAASGGSGGDGNASCFVSAAAYGSSLKFQAGFLEVFKSRAFAIILLLLILVSARRSFYARIKTGI